MKRINIIFLLVLSACISCTYMPVSDLQPDEPDVVSFESDLLPVFSKCSGCHPSSGGLDLSEANAYESIMDGRVNLQDPESSLIYTVPLNDHKGKEYSEYEANLVLKWIEDGALNN